MHYFYTTYKRTTKKFRLFTTILPGFGLLGLFGWTFLSMDISNVSVFTFSKQHFRTISTTHNDVIVPKANLKYHQQLVLPKEHSYNFKGGAYIQSSLLNRNCDIKTYFVSENNFLALESNGDILSGVVVKP